MAANSEEKETAVNPGDEKGALPVVFQCERCRGIIGDTSSWICAHQSLDVVCLSAVTSVVIVEEELETSAQGEDIGSTFLPLQCNSCKSPLGRTYQTTPRKLDMMRGMYTFDIDRITSYQIGNMENVSAMKSQGKLLDEHVQELHGEILKVKALIVDLDERLLKLEEQLEEIAAMSDKEDEEPEPTLNSRTPAANTNKRTFSEMQPNTDRSSSENDLVKRKKQKRTVLTYMYKRSKK